MTIVLMKGCWSIEPLSLSELRAALAFIESITDRRSASAFGIEVTIAALVGQAKLSMTSKYIHMLDAALIMAADMVAGYIRGLPDGIEFKQTAYALDRGSRKPQSKPLPCAPRRHAGCSPERLGTSTINRIMTAASEADAVYRLSASPPWSSGLSRKSPTVAPSGRVSTKAVQNRTVRETLVRK
jgi:hypothetical protein